jgi:GTPase SAR1 family protein
MHAAFMGHCRHVDLFELSVFSHALGQERYGNMTRIYYQGAFGAIIVFDVTRDAFLNSED